MIKKSFVLTATLAVLALPAHAAGVFDSSEQSITIKPASGSQAATTTQVDAVESASFKQAVSHIEQAQTVIRRDLAQYNAQYSEANARLVAAKAECKELKKNIRELNNKMKNTEKAKKFIGKNIPQTEGI